jgi:methanethiol S-methyltransferase
MTSYICAMTGWILWCTLHSALISPPVVVWMKKMLGGYFRFYRLAYNMVSLVTFIPVEYYSVSIHGAPILRWEGPLAVFQWILIALAFLLFLSGLRHYNMAHFAGFSQIRTRRTHITLSEHPSLDATGILGIVRHPWYVGAFLVIWAQDLCMSMVLNNIVLTAYLVVGTLLEERKLVAELGDQYRDYQRSVSMFFPYQWLKRRLYSFVN